MFTYCVVHINIKQQTVFAFLVKGVMNLIWIPVQQYQEDGRVIWGMRRGADSFISSSGFAVAELTTKLINLLQVHTLL